VKKHLAWMFASIVSFVATSSGCRFTHCEHGAVCDDDDDRDDKKGREDSCRALCDRLVVCGNVAGRDHEACMSQCSADFDRSPASTANGCRCVARASCSEIAARTCPGAPPIGGGYTPGTTTATGSTTVTGTGSATGSGSGTGSGSATGSVTGSGTVTGGASVTAGSTVTSGGAGGASSGAGGSSSSTSGAGGQPGGTGGCACFDGGATGGSSGATDAGLGMCGD
jgi:hypothetical protein